MKEAFEKIKERLEKEVFVAELYGGGWNGQTVDNLLCLGNVADVISEVEAECCNVETNADRIRSMSDEELAEFLPIVSNFLCRPTDECMNTICNRGECEKTKECALEWLKSPTTD